MERLNKISVIFSLKKVFSSYKNVNKMNCIHSAFYPRYCVSLIYLLLEIPYTIINKYMCSIDPGGREFLTYHELFLNKLNRIIEKKSFFINKTKLFDIFKNNSFK